MSDPTPVPIVAVSDATPCDLVVFTAHPDDAELNCGGTLALAARHGWKTGIVDFTRGELSTRGTPELRAREAAAAGGVLGVSCRVNLGLPDGHVRDTGTNRAAVVEALRRMQPRVALAPPLSDHHPDHVAVAELLSRSYYLAGVAKYEPELTPWRPHALLYYTGSQAFPPFGRGGAMPALVVDISPVFDQRLAAIRCYKSQFHEPDSTEKETIISHPEFLDAIAAKARSLGALIGVSYGEAYTTLGPVPVRDLVELYSQKPWELKKRPS